jgi:beta-lactamase class A
MRTKNWLFLLTVLVAQPALAQSTAPQLQLVEQRLAATVSENPGEYGIAAMDLTTGQTVSFNGDRAFPMASTVKVAVAATYLSEVDAGRRSLTDTVGAMTAEQQMNLMLTRSDNHATDMLFATLGGPATVDAWLHTQGLGGIRVDRNIARLLADRRDLKDPRDSSTPKAMLQLLRQIDTGSALKPQSRLVLLDMMRRCVTGKNRIKALLPAGTPVEHKTGTLSGFTGDVAFVTLPDGRRVAMAMFGRGGDNRAGLIATAARAIYDGFNTVPATATASTAPQQGGYGAMFGSQGR